jgi:hypothetical protein
LIGSVVIHLRCSTERSSNHRETVTTDPMSPVVGPRLPQSSPSIASAR